MARRQRRQRAAWQGPQRDESIDGMFAGMAEAASSKLNRDDIIVGTEAEALHVGLYLPALCLRYLHQSNILPLSRIIHVTGEEGSCKTAYAVEIMRWHMINGGGGAYIENENKDSPELRNSLLQWNERWLRRLEVAPSYSLDEWMKLLTTFLEIARAQQDHNDGPGHTIPIALIVDSIMATNPQMVIDKILKEGSPSLGYPVAARLISEYMRTITSMIKTYPFTIIGINHLKPSTDYMGRPTAVSPGGKSVKFMETYEIEMHKSPSGDIDTLDYGGIRLKLIARKNSAGPSRKQIVAEMLWWWQKFDDGQVRQRTGWDWDTSSIELLLAFGDERRANLWKTKGKKTVYKDLMDILPLKIVNSSKRLGYCDLLGFTKDNPVHFRQLGAALERRSDILEQLHQLLGIQDRRIWQPGVDYQQMLEDEQAATVEQAAAFYDRERVEDMPEVDADVLDPEGDAELSRQRELADAVVGDASLGLPTVAPEEAPVEEPAP